MARLADFERELKIATAGLEPQQIAPLLASTAREALADVISSGEASERYEKYVNSREGIPEEQVIPPGPIVYIFDYGQEIALWALEWARQHSPVGSAHDPHPGAYRDAWFLMAGGVAVDPEAIPQGVPITITNDVPYSRKIAIGHMKLSVPPGIVERMRQAVMAKYGNFVTAEVQFITLAGGYIVEGRRHRKGGGEMTYPSLEITPR